MPYGLLSTENITTQISASLTLGRSAPVDTRSIEKFLALYLGDGKEKEGEKDDDEATTTPMIYVDSSLDGISREHSKFEVDENDVCTVEVLGIKYDLFVRGGRDDEEGSESKKGINKPVKLERGKLVRVHVGDTVIVDGYRQTNGEKVRRGHRLKSSRRGSPP